MDQQEIPGDAKNYRKLFEYWFLAREEQKMQAALSRAARLSGDTELYLYLAQLQMEQRAWQAMHQTMLAACAEQLADRYVGRANVLLGISQLKLGDAVNARRSFINATLIAGANTQAAQWLEFMGAEPATRKESRRIVGVCYGSIDKQQAEDGTLIVDAPEAAADPGVEFQIKTVPSLRLFYASYEMPLAELAAQAKSQVVRMGVSLVKSGGSVDGPVLVISLGDLPAQGDPTCNWHCPAAVRPAPVAGSGCEPPRLSNAPIPRCRGPVRNSRSRPWLSPAPCRRQAIASVARGGWCCLRVTTAVAISKWSCKSVFNSSSRSLRRPPDRRHMPHEGPQRHTGVSKNATPASIIGHYVAKVISLDSFHRLIVSW
jgi:hypothetical protein